MRCGASSPCSTSQMPSFRFRKWPGCLGSKRRARSPTRSVAGRDRPHPRCAARSGSPTASPPARARQPAPLEPASLANVGRLIDEHAGGARFAQRDQPVHVAVVLRVPLFPNATTRQKCYSLPSVLEGISLELSSDSLVGQRMAVSFGIEFYHGLIDSAVEVIRTVERLMCEGMRLDPR